MGVEPRDFGAYLVTLAVLAQRRGLVALRELERGEIFRGAAAAVA